MGFFNDWDVGALVLENEAEEKRKEVVISSLVHRLLQADGQESKKNLLFFDWELGIIYECSGSNVPLTDGTFGVCTSAT